MARGSDCGKTCEDLNKDADCDKANFVSGCYCKPGFLRNSAWDCVPENKCGKSGGGKPKCGENAVFASCGNMCKKQLRKS